MSNPQKLGNYCNILRDDGLSYADHAEQLTFLLFLKMADDQSRSPFNKPIAVSKDYALPSLLARRELWLSVVEGLESVVSAHLQRAAHLRQSILQKAFTGALV